MAFIIFIFFVAAAISSVAAYFSLVGLGSIFAATFWGVVIMGGALEVGKIVTAKWVHANWRNPSAPWYFRGLLCFFVAALMAITSLGIYGYLSRGHLEQQAPLAGLSVQVAQLETQVQQKTAENSTLQKRLDQIGRITDKSLETSGRAGLRAAASQRRDTTELQGKIDANNQAINQLNGQLVPLKLKTGNVEGELGVAKFIAEAAGWSPEKAIRIIIALIMSSFDTLALSMFIMGSISLKQRQEAKRREAAGELGDVLPKEELIVPMPPVTEPAANRFVGDTSDAITIIKGDGPAINLLQERPARPAMSEEQVEEFKAKLEAKFMADLQEAAMAERDQLLDDLNKQIYQEREEFDTYMEEAKSVLDTEAGTIEEQKASLAQDHAALQDAHQQLLDMEARLNDERELLAQWQQQLTDQQNTINTWAPESDPTDGRSDKDKIISMLERNPQVVNDIIETVDAMRPLVKPGL